MATSFLNRNSYEKDIVELEREFKKKANKKGTYGFVFCDINDLKKVNDTYGHLTGDEYISEIAGAMLRNMKTADRIYRLGGDEFLALYINANEMKIKKEIADVYEECTQINQKKTYNVSVAMGYAISDDNTDTLKDVLRTADYRMYKKKSEMKSETVVNSLFD